MKRSWYRTAFDVEDYDLAATLGSGQAFRWDPTPGAGSGDGSRAWDGVLGLRWVRLRVNAAGTRIEAETVVDPGDWGWLRHYLRVEESLPSILASFPSDPAMVAAVEACRGLRLLRQDPWECLASFLLSSTKQIPQIRDGVRRLSERFGATLPGPDERPVHAFPAAEALAGARECDLRECRIGFRAKYLRSTAERVATGAVDLGAIGAMALSGARERLESLPGVGPKIADCVLLFAYGFGRAFPVDVWVMRALRDLYFRGRNTPLARLRRFSEDYFGAQAGYAQQYLFHHIRMRSGRVPGRGT